VGTPDWLQALALAEAAADEPKRLSALAGHGRVCSAAAQGPGEQVARGACDAALAGGVSPGALAELLRDILGNPFRHRTINPSWRTPDVLRLAAVIYEEHRFADLPVLADALEDAGYTDADLLGHCRGPGQHGRGCWAVDLVLGRS
jgi:hypothetical protein